MHIPCIASESVAVAFMLSQSNPTGVSHRQEKVQQALSVLADVPIS